MPSSPPHRSTSLTLASTLAAASLVAAPPLVAAPGWRTLESADGSHARARHEAGAVVVDGELYLLGGRGRPPLERFSTQTLGWTDLGAAPRELHHFQPVAIDGHIYVVGAFTCCYPREEAVAEIHVYDTRARTWDVVGEIPPARRRGSAAAIVRQQRIYLLGGNTRGHDGGAVAWFDEYDPATGEWRTLPDAPHARDHFTAALVGDTLVAAAGRRSTMPHPSANPVLATDVYDFASGEWRSVAPIPTPRAGTVTVAHGGEAIVAGGEINTSAVALDAVEAFDPASGLWRALPSLATGRHGAGAGVVDDTLHVVAGASSLGGAVETHLHETLTLVPRASPAPRDPIGSPVSDVSVEPSELTAPSVPAAPPTVPGLAAPPELTTSPGPTVPDETFEPGGEDGPSESTGPDGEPLPSEPDDASGSDRPREALAPIPVASPETTASGPDGATTSARRRGGLGGSSLWLLGAALGALAARATRRRGRRLAGRHPGARLSSR